MFVQLPVIGLGNEKRVVIEEVDFLLVAHAYVGMSAQKIMQRRRPGFLRTGQNEIEPLNFPTLGPKHRKECNRSFPVPPIPFREALECERVLASLSRLQRRAWTAVRGRPALQSTSCGMKQCPQLSRLDVPFKIRACTTGFARNFAVQFSSLLSE